MLHAVENIAPQYLWSKAFLCKLHESANNPELLNDRWFLGSYVLTGVRCLFEMGHDMTGLSYEKAQEQAASQQTIIDLIYSAMSRLTPRQFEQVFPIIKEYNGEKWQCKDFFYTRDYLRKLNMDEPIGEKIHDFL